MAHFEIFCYHRIGIDTEKYICGWYLPKRFFSWSSRHIERKTKNKISPYLSGGYCIVGRIKIYLHATWCIFPLPWRLPFVSLRSTTDGAIKKKNQDLPFCFSFFKKFRVITTIHGRQRKPRFFARCVTPGGHVKKKKEFSRFVNVRIYI
jgi:hypothetical protein